MASRTTKLRLFKQRLNPPYHWSEVEYQFFEDFFGIKQRPDAHLNTVPAKAEEAEEVEKVEKVEICH